MDAALNHLASSCEVMATLIDRYPTPGFGPVEPDKYFDCLGSSIIGQQLSVKAAATIESRVRQVLGEFTPEALNQVDGQALREAGLSRAKAEYLHHLADAFTSGAVVPRLLTDLPDEDVISTLTPIRGVGRWTAEMFLIFGLGRTDVWSAGDGGLTKGVKVFFGEDAVPTEVATRWAPYRSVAAWYVWEHVDRGVPPLS
jgi:DNA-3-methyladenine glycosylase II